MLYVQILESLQCVEECALEYSANFLIRAIKEATEAGFRVPDHCYGIALQRHVKTLADEGHIKEAVQFSSDATTVAVSELSIQALHEKKGLQEQTQSVCYTTVLGLLLSGAHRPSSDTKTQIRILEQGAVSDRLRKSMHHIWNLYQVDGVEGEDRAAIEEKMKDAFKFFDDDFETNDGPTDDIVQLFKIGLGKEFYDTVKRTVAERRIDAGLSFTQIPLLRSVLSLWLKWVIWLDVLQDTVWFCLLELFGIRGVLLSLGTDFALELERARV